MSSGSELDTGIGREFAFAAKDKVDPNGFVSVRDTSTFSVWLPWTEGMGSSPIVPAMPLAPIKEELQHEVDLLEG